MAAADKGGGEEVRGVGEGERKRTSGNAGIPLSAAPFTFLLEAVWADLLPFLFVHVPVLPGFAVTVDLVVVVAVTATCALPAPYAVSTLFAVSAPLAVTLNQCCGVWIRVRWAGGEIWAGLSPTPNLG